MAYRKNTTANTEPIYPQDAAPWVVQQKRFRDDWRTIATVPRANHTRSEALARYDYLSDFGKLRVVSMAQAKSDYQSGRAGKPTV